MRFLRRGCEGDDVRSWQWFLRGLSFFMGTDDGIFSAELEDATKKFQFQLGAEADGVVDLETLSVAMKEGYRPYDYIDIYESDGAEKNLPKESPAWPPRPDPSVIKPLSMPERIAKFGVIEFVHEPKTNNPENIRITNDWVRKNIQPTFIPQMKHLSFSHAGWGWPGNGMVQVHKLAAEAMQRLFNDWDSDGLLGRDGRLLSYAGCWVPRLVRGSTYLSNHAFGTAFDVNAPQNGLGKRPALLGKPGCVRELVESAVAHGFWWGGWGWPPDYRRLDGMHFEYVG